MRISTLLSAPSVIGILALFSFPGPLQGEGPIPPAEISESEALVSEALEKNPELVAVRAEALAAQSRASAAGALPDPMVSVNYENDGLALSLGSESMTRLTFMAQQALPFPGKQRLAEEIARKDAERIGTLPQRTALGLAAAVRRNYASLLEARENLRLVEEQLETWKAIGEIIRARYSAGMGNQQDVLRAQSEGTRLLQQRARDQAAERTALSELGGLLFRQQGASLLTERRLVPGPQEPLPGEADVMLRALETTPELKEAALVKERSSLAADLARRNLKPDFVASAGYMNRGGLPLMWSAGLGVSIPLWAGRKQRPLIAEAQSLASSAAATEASLRRKILTLTETRLIKLQQLAEEARIDAEGVLVQDQLTVDSSLASYRTGSVPFVAVLEALSTYFSDRRAAIGRLAALIRARADLEEFSLEGSVSSQQMNQTSASAPPKM